MRVIRVNITQTSYDVLIESGALSRVGHYIKELGFRRRAVVITNPLVAGLYGGLLKESLESAGFRAVTLEVPDGEAQKSLRWAGKLYTALAASQAERLTPIIALGGGVIGDLAGFVAATYMRGVPLIQVPTTFLAQVDSSIGGKVAVNHGRLKNIIGAFYQPRLVISDISALKTLSTQDMENGLAEVIKYGIINDRELFRLLEVNLNRIKAADEETLEEMVFRCAAIKAEIVEKDEKDTGVRNILNYGHTIGHALETVSHFRISHGIAVALGMVAAAEISFKMGVLQEPDLERIKGLIGHAGLPVKISGLNIQPVLKAMQLDKKKLNGKVRFVLPRTIGEVFIHDEVSPTTVEEVLKGLS